MDDASALVALTSLVLVASLWCVPFTVRVRIKTGCGHAG